jgi:hypothetical protein
MRLERRLDGETEAVVAQMEAHLGPCAQTLLHPFIAKLDRSPAGSQEVLLAAWGTLFRLVVR